MHTAYKSQSGPISQLRKGPSHPRIAKRGQSLIEACIAMGVICLVFFGLFQLSQVAAAREVIVHAAARGARAKTVGFNHFMVGKAIRVAAIPNVGHLTEPEFIDSNAALNDMVQTMNPGDLWDAVMSELQIPTTQQDLENARIPEYMAAANWPTANYILNYEEWNSVTWSVPAFVPDGDIMNIHVSQAYPLRIPFHSAFYDPNPDPNGIDTVLLHGVASIEGHYPLYLNDEDW